MLSAQVDKLRELATRYDKLQVGEVRAVTMPSEMGSILRDAADTICELRGSVHRERAENARLREELADAPKCETCEAMLDCDECLRADGSHKERRRLSIENAKLRELAKQMHICLTRPKVYDVEQPYLTATECPYFTEGACDYNACGFERRMRELGIE